MPAFIATFMHIKPSMLINPENRRNAINRFERFHGPKVIVLLLMLLLLLVNSIQLFLLCFPPSAVTLVVVAVILVITALGQLNWIHNHRPPAGFYVRYSI